MASPHSPKQNDLLAALPTADYERLHSHLELIPMPLGWAVYEAALAASAPPAGTVLAPFGSAVSQALVERHRKLVR